MWQLNKVEMVPPVIFLHSSDYLGRRKYIKIKTVATNWNKNYKASSPGWINHQFELIGSSVFCVVASHSWNNNLEQTEGSHYVAHIHGVRDDWALPLDCCGDGQSKGPLLNLWLLITWANDLNPFLTPLKVPLWQKEIQQLRLTRESKGKKIYIWFVVKKRAQQKQERNRGEERKCGPLGCVRGAWCFSGQAVESSAISLSYSTDTIWRGLYCLKLWVNDIWEAGVRHDSPVSPPDPKSSCERALSNFSAFSNGSSSLPLPPSFPPSLHLPPSLSHSLSFFPSSSDSH